MFTPAAKLGRRAFIAVAMGTAIARSAKADDAVVGTGYIRWAETRETISLLDKPPPDDGLAGAQLATNDNNTTGQFMGQRFELMDSLIHADDDVAATMQAIAGQGIGLVLTDVPAALLLQLASLAAAKQITLFNVQAPDDSLRQRDCRGNLIHVAPSRAMLADAIAQYLVWKKWSHWVLAYGSHPEDALLADDYRRSAKRFGARIVNEIEYRDAGGARQTDSGVVQTQQQMPVFTQNLPDYDVLVTADESEVFAGYLPYRTWDPRPVVGSAGLRPVSWDPNSESWGGTQLQDRFTRLAHRLMTPLDMQAWTACRMIGEAASRTGSADPARIVQDIKSPGFGVAAYKGVKLSLRDWDWQLRQPILLSDGRTVVSISPQPGFLHQTTELDTLGFDRPETECKLQ
ncbi:MAG: ABC transporter substrate-binding protein [Candidatus Eremiobacteraeota bacterium]|nr:ABC transporter substrate-binding protein [Candidatus Eremiobacteraeota bacterium]